MSIDHTTTFVDHGRDLMGSHGRIEKFGKDPLSGRTGAVIEQRDRADDGYTMFLHVLLDPPMVEAGVRVDSVWVYSGEWVPE